MIRGLWDRETVALMWLVAVFPLAAIWIRHGGVDALGLQLRDEGWP